MDCNLDIIVSVIKNVSVIDAKDQNQEVIGVLLDYGWAVNSTLLVALGTLVAAQSQGTQRTADACTYLLNYCATHSDAVIRYIACDMILQVHSDASYRSELKSRSLVGGLNYLSSRPRDPQLPPSPDDPPPPLNRAILVVSNIMKQVLDTVLPTQCCRRRNGRFVLQWPRGNYHPNHLTRNGLPTTAHTAPNRHHDRL